MGNFLILMNIYINPIAEIILKVEKLEDSQLISRNKARNHFFSTSNAIIVERKKWRENSCSWIGKLRVVKTVILPDLSNISNQNPSELFCGYEQTILKFI